MCFRAALRGTYHTIYIYISFIYVHIFFEIFSDWSSEVFLSCVHFYSTLFFCFVLYCKFFSSSSRLLSCCCGCCRRCCCCCCVIICVFILSKFIIVTFTSIQFLFVVCVFIYYCFFFCCCQFSLHCVFLCI